MYTNFNEFITESKGINNDVKDIIKDIIMVLNNSKTNIVDDYKNNSFKDHRLTLNRNNFIAKNNSYDIVINLNKSYQKVKIGKIYLNLNIFISDNLKKYQRTSDAIFYLNDVNIVNNIADNLKFKFNIYLTEKFLLNNFIITPGFVMSLTHELTHFIEKYNLTINNENLPLSYVYNYNLNLFKDKLTYNDKEIFNELYGRIYLTFEHEINANISELYTELNNTNVNSYNDLDILMIHCKSYKKYIWLNNFVTKNYIDNLITHYNDDKIINIFNEFISIMENDYNYFKRVWYKKPLTNINDIENFLKSLNFKFREKSDYAIKKFHKILTEIYDDKNK